MQNAFKTIEVPAAVRILAGRPLTEEERSALDDEARFYKLWADILDNERNELLQSINDLRWAADLLERGDMDALHELLDVVHPRILSDLVQIAKAGGRS